MIDQTEVAHHYQPPYSYMEYDIVSEDTVYSVAFNNLMHHVNVIRQVFNIQCKGEGGKGKQKQKIPACIRDRKSVV